MTSVDEYLATLTPKQLAELGKQLDAEDEYEDWRRQLRHEDE